MHFPAFNSLLVAFFLLFVLASNVQAKVAQVLLKFDNASKTYELNRQVLEEMSKLVLPIRVIAVLGDARIGKSTTLNMINHIWSGVQQTEVEEIFKTGNTQESVTHDVWAHVIHLPDDMKGSVVLLDVAGTNLGDDALTTHLSMFTALISSGLNVFVRETFQNNNLHFLYHLSRLSNIVFPNVTLKNFPKLRVVVRDPLLAPHGTTLEDHVQKSVAEPSFDENMQEERKTVAKYFPKEQIQVTQLPLVGRNLFLNFEKLRSSDYWGDMKRLVGKLKEVPTKKTLEGSPIDGQAIVELAEKLTEAMNANSWHAFGSVYDALEKSICKRSHKKLIEPLFEASTIGEIEEKIKGALEEFKSECVLESETLAAEEDLMKVEKRLREIKELAQNAEEAERKRQMDKKEFEENLLLKDEEISKQKKEKEEVSNKVQSLKRLYDEKVKSLEIFKQTLSKKHGGWMELLGAVVMGAGIGALLSDRDLKHNITTQPVSPYSAIGLNGVCWEWNEIAEKKFGQAGDGCGVIAQDVERLYPSAVTKEEDGYLRVRYDLLHGMIDNTRRVSKTVGR